MGISVLSENLLNGRDLAAARDACQTRYADASKTAHTAGACAEAKKRYPVGSELWARATAMAFDLLKLDVCAEAAKPEWWSDEGLKVLSESVVRAAPNDGVANSMRAVVLSGLSGTWEAGPRSATELKEAAMYFDRAAAMCPPAQKTGFTSAAGLIRRKAEAM